MKTCYLVSRVPEGRPVYPVKVFLNEDQAEKFRKIQSTITGGEYWRIDRVEVDIMEPS